MESKSKLERSELESIQQVVQRKRQIAQYLGGVEIEKYGAFRELDGLDANMKAIQIDLKAKYGEIEVNIEDGSYTLKDGHNTED
tara:strand:- start:41213 stop:41464 length:252 start_codon:yes stop_codon:yes gene_type:complete